MQQDSTQRGNKNGLESEFSEEKVNSSSNIQSVNYLLAEMEGFSQFEFTNNSQQILSSSEKSSLYPNKRQALEESVRNLYQTSNQYSQQDLCTMIPLSGTEGFRESLNGLDNPSLNDEIPGCGDLGYSQYHDLQNNQYDDLPLQLAFGDLDVQSSQYSTVPPLSCILHNKNNEELKQKDSKDMQSEKIYEKSDLKNSQQNIQLFSDQFQQPAQSQVCQVNGLNSQNVNYSNHSSTQQQQQSQNDYNYYQNQQNNHQQQLQQQQLSTQSSSQQFQQQPNSQQQQFLNIPQQQQQQQVSNYQSNNSQNSGSVHSNSFQENGAAVNQLLANEMLDDNDSMYALEQNIVDNIQSQDSRYYQVNPFYLQSLQSHLQWHMRTLLIDWMMEVCDEFALLRETYHLAVTYTDLYLSRKICPIDKLQLLGASSLMLACKIEEIVCPRVRDFAFATDHGFTHQQLVGMEMEISQIMSFQLYPTTLNYWANYYMAKWDIYAQSNPLGFRILQDQSDQDDDDSPRSYPAELPLFKTDSIEDYRRFRSLIQTVDLLVLDINSYRFNKLQLVASALYFQLGLHYKVFSRQQIAGMPDVSTLLIFIEQQGHEYVHVMQHFIQCYFGLQIPEIVTAMQYVGRFFGLDPCQDYPIIIQKQKKPIINQEEFFSFQAHVKGGMDFVKYLNQHFAVPQPQQIQNQLYYGQSNQQQQHQQLMQQEQQYYQ
eukprot:403375523